MIDLKSKKVIVLSPHPEDGEIGCGGLVQRLKQNKSKFWYVCFTDAALSTKPPFKPQAQINEMHKSTKMIGFSKERIIMLNFPVRSFSDNRQKILDYMFKLNKKIKPDLVLCHSRHDTHQDHSTITTEAIRAFKKTSILGYELPWNHFDFKAGLYIQLSKKMVNKKCMALRSYKSRSHRPYLKKKKIT